MAITSSYSVSVEETTHGTYYTWTESETITTFEWDIFVVSIIETALYAFIEYCVYYVLALLIASLASIVQHTKITANISLYTSAQAEGITEDYEEPMEEEKTVEKENDETVKTGEN